MGVSKLTINPADIAKVKGVGYTQGVRIYKDAMQHYKKERHQDLTIREFCDYKGHDIKDVCMLINVAYWVKEG